MYTAPLRLGGALIALVALALSLATPAAPVAQAAGEAGGTPAAGTIGTVFSFYVDGLTATEEVDYWFVGPGSPQPFEQGIFLAEPDANGRTTRTWTAPGGVWNGTWTWNLRGRTSRVVATVPFELSGATGEVVNSGVDPAVGVPGDTFTFSTDGWPNGDIVDYWVLAPGQTEAYALGRIYGDRQEDGRTYWRWKAPKEIWGGVWTMNARGFYSEIQIQIPFTINGGPPPPPPTASVSAGEASPGQALQFRADGYTGGEEIAWWINAPSSNTPVDRSGIDEYFADAAGMVTFTWSVPLDAVSGQWSAVIRGVDSRVEQKVLFTVVGGASAPASSGPTVEMSPRVAAPGATLAFTATGFHRKDILNYWATGPDGVVVSDNQPITTLTDGSGVWSWTTPVDMPPGQWVVSVQGPKSNVRLELPLEITPSGTPPAPTSGVTPASGTFGTTFSFFAEGFGPEEPIGWWVTAPSGATTQGDPDQRATLDGHFAWSWKTPPDVAPGRWQAVVRGKRTGLERSIFFEVTNGTGPAAPTAPSGTVSPERGAPGTAFAFSAAGLTPRERIGFWAEGPDGSRYSGSYEPNANREGEASWSWTAPADAASGQWTMVLQSRTGGEVNGNTSLRIGFVIE